MTPARELLSEATRLVLQTWGDGALVSADDDLHAAAPVMGVVHPTGAWEGTVAVYLSPPLARILAAFMFDCTPESASADQVVDTVGEVANMIGGSLKSLLASNAKLSLPTVEPCSSELPRFRSRHLGQFTFRCHESIGRVVLWAQRAEPTRYAP